MTRDLYLDRSGPFLRAALFEEGEPVDLLMDRPGRPGLTGAIFRGKVGRIVPGLDGAFVELGPDLPQGLLTAADVRPRPPTKGGAKGEAGIGRLLRSGQEVLVQAKADAHGAKGPTLTMDITLPGRFLVSAPLGEGLHLSRRIGKGPARTALQARIRALLDDVAPPSDYGGGGGWIVRADAADADPALLAQEAEALVLDWRDVQRTGGTAPSLLRSAPAPAERALVEFGARLDRIRVRGGELVAAVKRWLTARAPDLLDRLSPVIADDGTAEELDALIHDLSDRRVPLAEGGSLVVDRTEALTVVDVNGGERGNALATNLEAARVLARQLRLRNVGGVVVVDFIDMKRPEDRERLLLALSHAVSDDPAGTHVYGMSKLGLVEMTRGRRGPALADLLADATLFPPGTPDR